MQPLFLCANAQLKRRLLIAALQDHHPVAYRLRTVLQHHFRQQRHAASQGDHRHHRFVPADGGVDRRIADFMPPKPQLDAPTYRPWSAMIKGTVDQSGRSTVTWLRTGQGRAGAINTTARFSSIENATDPGRVSGLPAIARSASPVTTFSIASAASPVESLISTEGARRESGRGSAADGYRRR